MSTKTRLAALEGRAAAANPAHSGVMTPEEYAALERGEFIWPDGSPSGGVFILSDVMTPEEWERAARKHMAKLTGQS